MSIANYAENKILDAVLNHTTTGGGLPAADVYVKLHIGDPGEDGTANPAAETTREQASFAAAAAGSATTDADLDWAGVTAAETYSHVSLWDDPAAGNCLWTGALTAAKTVNAGDDFKILAGQLTVNLD